MAHWEFSEFRIVRPPDYIYLQSTGGKATYSWSLFLIAEGLQLLDGEKHKMWAENVPAGVYLMILLAVYIREPLIVVVACFLCMKAGREEDVVMELFYFLVF